MSNRPHINADGKFQSDKYPTCPPGKCPLSVEDPTAQDLLWEYAQRRRARDEQFADDLEHALRAAGYEPPSCDTVDLECAFAELEESAIAYAENDHQMGIYADSDKRMDDAKLEERRDAKADLREAAFRFAAEELDRHPISLENLPGTAAVRHLKTKGDPMSALQAIAGVAIERSKPS